MPPDYIPYMYSKHARNFCVAVLSTVPLNIMPRNWCGGATVPSVICPIICIHLSPATPLVDAPTPKCRKAKGIRSGSGKGAPMGQMGRTGHRQTS